MSPLSPLPHIPIDTKPTTAKSKPKPKPKIKSIDYIKQHYIQLCANEEGLWLEVMEIGWQGPHTPVSKWTPVLQIGVNPPQWAADTTGCAAGDGAGQRSGAKFVRLHGR